MKIFISMSSVLFVCFFLSDGAGSTLFAQGFHPSASGPLPGPITGPDEEVAPKRLSKEELANKRKAWKKSIVEWNKQLAILKKTRNGKGKKDSDIREKALGKLDDMYVHGEIFFPGEPLPEIPKEVRDFLDWEGEVEPPPKYIGISPKETSTDYLKYNIPKTAVRGKPYREFSDILGATHYDFRTPNGERVALEKISERKNRQPVLLEQHLFKNGVKHGIQRTWHLNKQLKSAISYKKGIRHGECKHYNVRGQLIGWYAIHNGKGAKIIYYPNGHLKEEIHYFENQKHGPSIDFHSTGYPEYLSYCIKNSETTDPGIILPKIGFDSSESLNFFGFEDSWRGETGPFLRLSTSSREKKMELCFYYDHRKVSTKEYTNQQKKNPLYPPVLGTTDEYKKVALKMFEPLLKHYKNLKPVKIPLTKPSTPIATGKLLKPPPFPKMKKVAGALKDTRTDAEEAEDMRRLYDRIYQQRLLANLPKEQRIQKQQKELIQQLIATVEKGDPPPVPDKTNPNLLICDTEAVPKAIVLLGKLRAAESVDSLIKNIDYTPEILFDPLSHTVCYTVPKALVEIGKPASQKALLHLRTEKNPTRRTLLLEVVKQVEGKPMTNLLIQSALTQKIDGTAKANLKKALAELKTNKEIEKLEPFCFNDFFDYVEMKWKTRETTKPTLPPKKKPKKPRKKKRSMD